MTIEANKRIMQRFTEFINTASEKLAAELISPNAVFHVPGRLAPAGSGWVSRNHWNDAKRFPGHPMDAGRDDCRR